MTATAERPELVEEQPSRPPRKIRRVTADDRLELVGSLLASAALVGVCGDFDRYFRSDDADAGHSTATPAQQQRPAGRPRQAVPPPQLQQETAPLTHVHEPLAKALSQVVSNDPTPTTFRCQKVLLT